MADPTPQHVQTATESVLADLERFLIGSLIASRAQALALRDERDAAEARLAEPAP